MLRCIDLALRGAMFTSPNPQVGSVIVSDGKVIGEGYHQRCGGPHAEVEAIHSVKESELLLKSTLYVNLEPCSHHGKTPPCADLIIEKKIPRVVVANVDPNPMVSGKGIERLRNHGVEVTEGICAAEAEAINRPFFVHHRLNRPYYLAKWARTADGFMGRLPGSADSPRITSGPANRLVHQLRAESDAILVGSRTANQDDPALNTRLVKGPSPLRIIVDPLGELRDELRLLHDGLPNIILSNESKQVGNSTYVQVSPSDDLYTQLDKTLLERDLVKILVEGGAHTLNELARSGRMDECIEITAPVNWLEGVKAPTLKGLPIEEFDLGADHARRYLYPEVVL